MARLTIQVLGGLHIQLAGTHAPLEFPTRKSRAVLAYLALSPGMLRTREQLASVFWDRSADEQARASLRQTLSSLRRLLPDAPLLNAETDAIWLDAHLVEVDALQFVHLASQRSADSLKQAVSLYRGALLDGFGLREDSFEQWMTVERRWYHERAMEVFAELAGLYEQSDEWDRAIETASKALIVDPLLEWAHAALIRLYARTGRRDAAVRQYQECVRVLNAELGIAPAESTQRLAARIQHESVPRDVPQTPARSAGNTAQEPERTSSGRELPAERKQLSVLCVRVREPIDASDASDASDPEIALGRIDPVLKAMIEVVQRFGGLVTQLRSDGMTALFGAPVAHEDHAVRACYAALEMREAVLTRSAPSLEARIGIHSGEAVVRTIGNDQLQHYDALGAVPELANRIDSVLAAGEIGVSADTARSAEGFIELADAPARTLVGATPAMGISILQTKSALRLRWNARSARSLSRFVGRDAEMANLRWLLERAARGAGQVCAVIGEPGVGKSRLVHEFVDAARAAGWTTLETGTISHDTSAIYLPFANLLRSWFGIVERDTIAEVADRLRQGICAIDPALAPTLPALAALLDLPSEDSQWDKASPPQRRKHTLEAIAALVMRASENAPLILVVEDLHWNDDGTQAVLDHLVDCLGASRVLLLATCRPEYRHAWSGKSYFSQLRVDNLDAGSGEQLLHSLLGNASDTSEARELRVLCRRLIERTECTPLFLEESVRALADAGALVGQMGAYQVVRTIDTFDIPSTVHAVLASRIDRLSAQQKTLLQLAAVIGHEFSIDLLQPIAQLDQERVLDLIGDLQAAEFIYQTRLLPQRQYTFKHALTHRVAYASVLKERRRSVHRHLVQVVECLHAQRLDEHVERLAHHALAGELWDKAVVYLYRSAGKALQRSAFQQAIEHVNKGLAIIRTLPRTPALLRHELELHKVLGVTMMAAKGWAATEVLDAYTQARALCEELGDDSELFTVLRGEGQYRMIRGESAIARELGNRCTALAEHADDRGIRIETHHLFWTNSFFMGEYATAEFHATSGMALYERERDHALTFKYSGHDPGVCCRCFTALAQCLRGYPDKSLSTCDGARQLAQELDHPLTTALAYWTSSFAHLLRGEPELAKQWAQKEIAVCEQYDLPLLLSQGTFQLGCALAQLGSLDDGIRRMRDGIAAISATGAEMGLPYFNALLGEALGRAGEPEAGLVEIERALAAVAQHGGRFQLPEMLRIKGELLAARWPARRDEALACMREAIVIAQMQGAQSALLRAAVSLARQLASSGDMESALSVLLPACEGVREGSELADSRTAQALLDQLNSR
ncbi:AAA family ATPase [Paraburkholderia bengalensis]|uniref:AAA family ATPase n=1 Tax=Paraburkholderia bengalensis TaxID=2747562 RepID=A0ABU8IJS5_9BURK